MKNKNYINFNWSYIEFNNFNIETFKDNLNFIINENINNKTILFSVLIKSKQLDITKSLTKILVFKNDCNLFNEIYNYAFMNYNKEEYKELPFDTFIFRYTFVDDYLVKQNSLFFKESYITNYDKLEKSIYNYRLPYHPEVEINICDDIRYLDFLINENTKDLTHLIGIEKYIKVFKDIIQLDKYINKNIPLNIGKKKSFNNENLIYVYQFKFDNKYLTFKIIELGDKKVIRDCHLDIILNSNTYIRKINNKTLYINKGVLLKYENQYKVSKLKTLNRSSFRSPFFMTLDIETLNIDNKLIPYAIGFYDGKEFVYEYGNDNIILNLFKKLFIKKYHNHVVYVHNLSKFDYIYLIDQLSKMNHKVEIIPSSSSINIVKFIIKYEIDGKIYKINFHDSYQILSSSLDKLCESFNVETKKSLFPYEFMDSLDKINYIGKKPDKYLYIKGLPDNYDNIKIWDAKKETLEYLKNDCISLYQIIDKFSYNIHLLNGVDISKYPTLPSIAMAIFRTKYYDLKMNIVNLKGKVRNYIQKGYFGGIVDVYKPQGENLYCYDVKDLYKIN